MSNNEVDNLPITEDLSKSEVEHSLPELETSTSFAQPAPAMLPGSILAAKREEFRWSLQEAAERLKLTPRQVTALESNDFAALPGMSSVRGFVRSYAKLMGMDPEPLLETISGESNSSQGHFLLRRPLPMNGFPGRRSSPPPRSRPGAKKLVASMFLVTALAAVAYEGYRSEWLPVSMLDEVMPELSFTWPSFFTASALEENQIEKISQAVSEKMSGTPAPVLDPSKSLEVIVSQDAWIEVTTQAGTKIVSRLMKAGTKEMFEINEPVVLVVGNASGVQAKLRGQVLNLKAVAHDNVSKLNLK